MTLACGGQQPPVRSLVALVGSPRSYPTCPMATLFCASILKCFQLLGSAQTQVGLYQLPPAFSFVSISVLPLRIKLLTIAVRGCYLLQDVKVLAQAVTLFHRIYSLQAEVQEGLMCQPPQSTEVLIFVVAFVFDGILLNIQDKFSLWWYLILLSHCIITEKKSVSTKSQLPLFPKTSPRHLLSIRDLFEFSIFLFIFPDFHSKFHFSFLTETFSNLLF